MATAHLSVKVGKAGKSTPHAEYISRMWKYAQRLEHGEKLEHSESGNMPKWAQNNPLDFWRAADQYERKNGTVYREHEIALPRELNAEQRAELVREWVQNELGDRHAYTWAIHNKTALDGGEQPHVHLMFSERMNDGIERDPEQYFKRYNAKFPERGGAKKHRSGETPTERKEALKAMRDRWEQLHNAHLEKHGYGKGISMKSLAEQGIDRKAEPHMTPSESAALQRKAAADRAAAEFVRTYTAERKQSEQTEPKQEAKPRASETDFRQPESEQATKRDFYTVYKEFWATLGDYNRLHDQRTQAQENADRYAKLRSSTRETALAVSEQYKQRKEQKSGFFGLMKNKEDERELQQLANRYAVLKADYDRYDQEQKKAEQQRKEIHERTQPKFDELSKKYQELRTELNRLPMDDFTNAVNAVGGLFKVVKHEQQFERLSTIARNELKHSGWSGELGEKLSCGLILDRAQGELKRIGDKLQREHEQQRDQSASRSRDDWEMER